jgi:hypothetical protein
MVVVIVVVRAPVEYDALFLVAHSGDVAAR